jgi:hypothetical protein
VITYEQQNYSLYAQEREEFIRTLSAYNIFWHPLTWTTGNFILLKKSWELLLGFCTALKIFLLYRPRAIFALANIAGSFCYIISRILPLKLILFTYEPHSEFMRDCGVWSSRSLKFRILNKLEKKMGIHANYIATGTSHMIERLKKWNTRAKIYRVPSCIDHTMFYLKEAERSRIRNTLNIQNRKVFIYLGKFGDLYYKDEIAVLCHSLLKNFSDAFFLIVTPNPAVQITSLFTGKGIPVGSFFVTRAAYEEVPSYISASDMGIVAVPPLESQKYRSPIKVGEYLSCGVPYIVCRGVSEDDWYAEKYNVGVVLENFSPGEVREKSGTILSLLNEGKNSLSERCRNIGIMYRGKHIAVDTFTEIFNEIYPA